MTTGLLTVLSLTILGLIALIAALIMAWISTAGGNTLRVIIRDAGISFGGVMTLGLAILGAARLLGG